MVKIIFICPFFGKLPENQMKIWLKSCRFNKTIDWLIFTDDETVYDCPDNVVVKRISFSDFKAKIRIKIPFVEDFSSPYKLCDFKPTYGFIFEEYTKGYDFWGHCDLSDCIFGNLRKFLDDDILQSSEKIFFLGHMTLYKNVSDVNQRFFLETKSGIPLDKVLNGSNKAFDEINATSINTIYQENGFKITRLDNAYADISPMKFAFVKSCYDDDFVQYYEKQIPLVYEWDEGCLFELCIENLNVKKREIGYVHFQKRKMDCYGDILKNHFVIRPNAFDFTIECIDKRVIKELSKDQIFYKPYFKLKLKNLKYRINCFLGRNQ